jgi:flagellar biogenesis protein FliO
MQILGVIGPIEITLVAVALLILLFILLFLGWILYKWTNNNMNHRREQNELLREIIRHLEKKI